MNILRPHHSSPRKEFLKEFSLWQLIPKELKDIPVVFIGIIIPFYKKVFTILHTCVYCSQKKHACNNILLKIVLFYSHIMSGMLILVTNIVHNMD
ncbi:hypothetical protein D9X75_24755 [Escherichia coli]|nr:hypothetical protein [Escherichia coli]